MLSCQRYMNQGKHLIKDTPNGKLLLLTVQRRYSYLHLFYVCLTCIFIKRIKSFIKKNYDPIILQRTSRLVIDPSTVWMSYVFFNELMHDWRHMCVCMCMWVYVLCYVSSTRFLTYWWIVVANWYTVLPLLSVIPWFQVKMPVKRGCRIRVCLF